tara:strand:+ start:173 stop:430 length:258 start_codon:yes stop_codon:yes gene_type:complete
MEKWRKGIMQQIIRNFSRKQIIVFALVVLLSIYVVWYVVDALEGLDPNYRPTGTGKLSDNNANQGAKGNDFFDPSKESAESATTK